MITNFDEQAQFVDLMIQTMSKIADKIPHLESGSEARGYLNYSTFALKLMSQMLDTDFRREVLRQLDEETKSSNELIDRLMAKRLL